jgi:hypothetical protein
MEKLSNPEIDYLEEYVVTSGEQVRLKDLAKRYEQENHVKLNINWGGRPYREREVMKPYIGNDIMVLNKIDNRGGVIANFSICALSFNMRRVA